MSTHRIAVVGGTGPQGQGLAYRFARQGHRIVLGSRSAERAESSAAEILARVPHAQVSGATNRAAADGADVVVLAVPYDGHDELVASMADALASTILVSCVNPLGFDQQGPYGLEVKQSAAESAAALVPTARVVGAFHHVSAVSLWGAGRLPRPRGHPGLRRRPRGQAGRDRARPRGRGSRRGGRRTAPAGPSARAAHRRPHLGQQALQDPLRHRRLGPRPVTPPTEMPVTSTADLGLIPA